LKNLGALLKLNPYAKTARRMELLAQEQRAKAKAEKLDSKRKISKVWFSLGHLTSLQHYRHLQEHLGFRSQAQNNNSNNHRSSNGASEELST
jgi:hypothetical protein